MSSGPNKLLSVHTNTDTKKPVLMPEEGVQHRSIVAGIPGSPWGNRGLHFCLGEWLP
jgi:hypothetical protein